MAQISGKAAPVGPGLRKPWQCPANPGSQMPEMWMVLHHGCTLESPGPVPGPSRPSRFELLQGEVQFPAAAVTKDHKPGGLKQHTCSYGLQVSSPRWVTRGYPKALAGCLPPAGSGRRVSRPFPLPGAAHIPWPVPLHPSNLCVCCHIFSLTFLTPYCKDLVMTLGPPGSPRIVSPSRDP